MRDFPRTAPTVVLLLLASCFFFQCRWGDAQVVIQSTPGRPQQIKYFTLEHRSPDSMDAADRELLRTRQKDLIIEAQIYGYDITTSDWTYDQSVCPQLPNTLLLHYLKKFPDGSESLFTALIPRGAGRTRIVPVLYRNSSPYSPAIKNPRNFAIFNTLVPEDIAKNDSGPDGKWLSLGVCYAEIVGARPNVPDDPSLDAATIKAPVATYRYDTATKQRQIEFSDRAAAKVFTIWTISLNENGRVTGATNEDYATYVARIVQPPAPPGTTTQTPPPLKVIPEPPAPPLKTTPVPSPQ
jgi:hypothetical protein